MQQRRVGFGNAYRVSMAILVLGLANSAMAQSLDTTLEPSPKATAPVEQQGSLDTRMEGTMPIVPPRPAESDPRSNVQSAVRMLGNGAAPVDPAPVTVDTGIAGIPVLPIPSGSADLLPKQAATIIPPREAEVVALSRPKVIDTARLQSGETVVTLFGIEGVGGVAAQGLQSFLGTNAVSCQPKAEMGFVCLTPDGTDLAQVALVNGAAKTRIDAPDPYREQESAAQAARRGIWANLPPPPELLKHPIVRTTSVIVANGKSYMLDAVEGFAAPYADQLQGYIAANGDNLTCSVQSRAGHYICLMPDGTDIAKSALVNGVARVAGDAPDSYRAEQLAAVENRRGYWATASDTVMTAALVTRAPQTQYVMVAGDDGSDGVRYVGGAPTIQVGGAPVFLSYADGLGWGYYDGGRRWRGAPYGYVQHMERFHPGGMGLRAYSRAGPMPMIAPRFGTPMARPMGIMPQRQFAGNFMRPPPMASAGGFHPAAPRMAAPAPHQMAAAPGRHR